MSDNDQKMALARSKLADVGLFHVVKTSIKSKAHVPLPNIRDRPGIPYNNDKCMGCGRATKAKEVFRKCSRCLAVKYCSRDCQVKDWQGLGNGPAKPRTHKDVCPELIETLKEFQSDKIAGEFLRKQVFSSWADQHCENGSFHVKEFLGRKKLLGGVEVGFWAMPDVFTPYHTSGRDMHGFQNGQVLLMNESFPTVAKGWTSALQSTEQVNVTKPPPVGTHSEEVRGWEDYLVWRNLPPTSVAPLLMTNVLTIYHMIKYELKLASQKKLLLVYVLAAEVELNQIQLLQELLYLLPGIDLQLVYVSPATKEICDRAKSAGRKCLITQGEFVLDVSDAMGSRLRVKLDGEHGLYEDVPNTIIPDAVIGLNTGLGSYTAWNVAMNKILRMRTPFSFSDQTRLIHRFTETIWFPSVVQTLNNAFPGYKSLVVPELTVKLNPFHGVIGRDIALTAAPNLSNGYIMTAFP